MCPMNICSFSVQNLMAKALYDNVPESPEELAFRKGDILTVIEQNTGGLEGWWLCSLHGRQGIAPGNRLKLLIGPMFDAQSPAAAATQSPPQGYQQKAGSGSQGLYQVPPSLQSPQQQGQQSIYQVPPGQDIYQVPPRSTLAAENAPSKVSLPKRERTLQLTSLRSVSNDLSPLSVNLSYNFLINPWRASRAVQVFVTANGCTN